MHSTGAQWVPDPMSHGCCNPHPTCSPAHGPGGGCVPAAGRGRGQRQWVLSQHSPSGAGLLQRDPGLSCLEPREAMEEPLLSPGIGALAAAPLCQPPVLPMPVWRRPRERCSCKQTGLVPAHRGVMGHGGCSHHEEGIWLLPSRPTTVGARGTHAWVVPVLPAALALGAACAGTWASMVPGDPAATRMLAAWGRAHVLLLLWKALVWSLPSPAQSCHFLCCCSRVPMSCAPGTGARWSVASSPCGELASLPGHPAASGALTGALPSAPFFAPRIWSLFPASSPSQDLTINSCSGGWDVPEPTFLKRC